MKSILLILLTAVAATLHAAEPTLSSLQLTYKAEQERLKTKYIGALEKLFEQRRTEGKLEEALAIRKEIDTHSTAIIPGGPQLSFSVHQSSPGITKDIWYDGASADSPKTLSLYITDAYDDHGDHGLHIEVSERDTGRILLKKFTSKRSTAVFTIEGITTPYITLKIYSKDTNGNLFHIKLVPR